MSCRVVRPGDAVRPAGVAWRKAAGGHTAPHMPGVAVEDRATGDGSTAGLALDDRVRHELAQREDAARRRGFQEGEESARKALEARVEAAVQKAAASAETILGQTRQMRRQMEGDLVHLAVAIARRILHREIQVDPEALAGIVKAAVHKLDARELHRVRACPDDVAIVEKYLAQSPLPSRVEIVADPSLERGGLLLETARGYLDASMETQLREIDRGLADVVRRA
jgi:flagellar assembly protein FliH